MIGVSERGDRAGQSSREESKVLKREREMESVSLHHPEASDAASFLSSRRQARHSYIHPSPDNVDPIIRLGDFPPQSHVDFAASLI